MENATARANRKKDGYTSLSQDEMMGRVAIYFGVVCCRRIQQIRRQPGTIDVNAFWSGHLEQGEYFAVLLLAPENLVSRHNSDQVVRNVPSCVGSPFILHTNKPRRNLVLSRGLFSSSRFPRRLMVSHDRQTRRWVSSPEFNRPRNYCVSIASSAGHPLVLSTCPLHTNK